GYVGLVGHRRAEHDGMALRVIRRESESVRDFTLVLEDIDPAVAGYAIWELRLAPADVERRHHVIEKVGGNPAGVVPVLAEAEEAVGVDLALGPLPKPHLPIDEVIALRIRSRTRID